MSDPDPSTSNRAMESKSSRRRVLGAGASVAAVLLAGCSAGTGGGSGAAGTAGGDDTPSSSDGTATASGSFRLLVSDRPADIGDFERLDVSLDRARIFRAGSGDDSQSGDVTATANSTATTTANATATTTANATATTTANATATTTANATATESPEDDSTEDTTEDDGQPGFTVVDLDGVTVDLTQVVGEKAVSAFEGDLPAGRYAKVELYVADVEGVVDGDPADVKVPSGKLQLVKPFEVVAGEELSFVFDINVVKKGQGGYNLLPVISESGVAGEDVAVDVVGDESEGSDAETETETETETTTTDTPESEGDGTETGPGQSGGNGQSSGSGSS